MNVLAIGAHFDDVEMGCGGSLAKHSKSGDDVYVLVATLSGFTNSSNEQVRCSEKAHTEAVEAGNILGVKELICGKFKTFELEFVEALNVEILRVLEEKNINLVYAHWYGDAHHDHQAVAKAIIHCCRHVPNVFMYRSNWYHSTQQFRGNYYVDITDTWEQKKKAIQVYASEIERTGGKWISFFKNEAENAGYRIGVKYAEVFEVIKCLN
jgi:LmbE family N-acetylglucosaminyl deacetylase